MAFAINFQFIWHILWLFHKALPLSKFSNHKLQTYQAFFMVFLSNSNVLAGNKVPQLCHSPINFQLFKRFLWFSLYLYYLHHILFSNYPLFSVALFFIEHIEINPTAFSKIQFQFLMKILNIYHAVQFLA